MKRPIFLVMSVVLIGILVFPGIADAGVSLPNPLGDDFNSKNLIDVMVKALAIVLGAVDIFALFMFILGGFELLMSGGNPTLVKKGKDTLVWATVGILVITLSYSILKFVFEGINQVAV